MEVSVEERVVCVGRETLWAIDISYELF